MINFDDEIRQSSLRWGSVMAQRAINELEKNRDTTTAPSQPKAIWSSLPPPQQKKILDAYTAFYKANQTFWGENDKQINDRIEKIKTWSLNDLLKSIKYIQANSNDEKVTQHLLPINDELKKAAVTLIKTSFEPATIASIVNGETEAVFPSTLVGSNALLWNEGNAREKDLVIRHFQAFYKANQKYWGETDEQINIRLKKIDTYTLNNIIEQIAYISSNAKDSKVAQYLTPILATLRKLGTEACRLPEELNRQEQVLLGQFGLVKVEKEAREKATKGADKVADDNKVEAGKRPEYIRNYIKDQVEGAIKAHLTTQLAQKGKENRLALVQSAAYKFSVMYLGKEAKFEETFVAFRTFLNKRGGENNANFATLYSAPEAKKFMTELRALLTPEQLIEIDREAEDRTLLYFEAQQARGESPLAAEFKKASRELSSLNSELTQRRAIVANPDILKRFRPDISQADIDYNIKMHKEKITELEKKLPNAKKAYDVTRGQLTTLHRASPKWDEIAHREELGGLWEKSREAVGYINPGKYGIPNELETFAKIYGINPTSLADWQAQFTTLSADGDNPNDYNLGLAALTGEIYGLNGIPSSTELTGLFNTDQAKLYTRITNPDHKLTVDEWNNITKPEQEKFANYLGSNKRLVVVDNKILVAARQDNQWHLLDQNYSNYHFTNDTLLRGDEEIVYRNLLEGRDDPASLATKLKSYWEEASLNVSKAVFIPTTGIHGENGRVYSVSRSFNQESGKVEVSTRPVYEGAQDYETFRLAVEVFGGLNREKLMGNNPLAGNDALTRQMLGLSPWTQDRIDQASKTLGLNDQQKAAVSQVLTGQARLIIRGNRTNDAVNNSDFYLYNITDGTTKLLPRGSEERKGFEKALTLIAAGRSPANTPETQLGFALSAYQNDLNPQTARDNYIETIALNLAARLTQAMTAEQLGAVGKWDEEKTTTFSSGFASILVGCGKLNEGTEKAQYDRSVQAWAEGAERNLTARFDQAIAQMKRQNQDFSKIEQQKRETLALVTELRGIYLKLGEKINDEKSWGLFANLNKDAVNSNAQELGKYVIAYVKSPDFGVVRGN